jgi:hypothetical protein
VCFSSRRAYFWLPAGWWCSLPLSGCCVAGVHGGHQPLIAIVHNGRRHVRLTKRRSAYSLLRTIEAGFRFAHLGHAAQALQRQRLDIVAVEGDDALGLVVGGGAAYLGVAKLLRAWSVAGLATSNKSTSLMILPSCASMASWSSEGLGMQKPSGRHRSITPVRHSSSLSPNRTGPRERQ